MTVIVLIIAAVAVIGVARFVTDRATALLITIGAVGCLTAALVLVLGHHGHWVLAGGAWN